MPVRELIDLLTLGLETPICDSYNFRAVEIISSRLEDYTETTDQAKILASAIDIELTGIENEDDFIELIGVFCDLLCVMYKEVLYKGYPFAAILENFRKINLEYN